MAKNKYTANDIEVLEGLEGVQKNIGMYLGEASTQVLRAFREIYENSVDVFAKGMNKFIAVGLSGTKIPQTFTVVDHGPGIPVEKHKKTGISTLTTVFTTIHAGSNFDKLAKGKAKSRGTHGVGSSATNACSESFIVYTCRDKQWYTQSFSKGKPVSDVSKCKLPKKYVELGASKSCGTVVEFTPDYSLLPKTVIKEQELFEFIKQNAELNSGLTVRFVGPKIDEKICNKKGIITLLEDWIVSSKKKVVTLGRPFIFESPDLSVALQWSDLEGENVFSYVNYAETAGGGYHVQGLFDAITKEFKAAAKKGVDFTAADLREGLIAVIHYKCNDDDYSGQNKEKLSTISAQKIVRDTVAPALTKWIKANAKLVRQIMLRATKIKEAKEQAKAITKAATSLKTTNKSALIPDGKLAMSNPRCAPEQRELFICEGDSAGGNLVQERDPYYQEILKLRGKILNVAKTSSIAKDLQNAPLVNLLVALGADEKLIRKGEKITSFRVGKIVLLTDEDIDGKHIKVLLFTALDKYAPEAFKQGIVYIADVPFFQASNPRTGEKVFGSSLEDVQTKGGKNWHVSRLKGLGEMNKEELAPFCLYPESRRLIRIPYFKSSKEREEYIRLVGEDVQYRKEMLGVD